MKNISDIFSQFPLKHHAYGIESYVSCADDIATCFPAGQVEYLFQKTYERLTVDDVRTIKRLQSEKTDGSSIFILEVSVIGHEAQNALLKMFEEPTANTFFVLVSPHIRTLLPTLRSRLEIIIADESSGSSSQQKISAQDFVNMELSERFDHIKTLTDTKNKDALTKRELLLFLNDCEKRFAREHKNEKLLPIIYESKQFLSASGASHKMILDNLAIHMSYCL